MDFDNNLRWVPLHLDLKSKYEKKAMVTKCLEEQSFEIEGQPPPKPLEHTLNPASVVTPYNQKTPPSRPPEIPTANQPPSDQQKTPTAVAQRPKRDIKESEYLKDYVL